MNPANFLVLNTGAKIPVVGLGTWKSKKGEVGAAVEHALEQVGYRHLDCAAIYRNEPEVGGALEKVWQRGAVKREEVFITSKLWNGSHARAMVGRACRQTLRDLRLDYLDLYLMHWGITEAPGGSESQEPLDEHGVLRTELVPVGETWEAMEELVKLGLVKAIGVANFTGAMLVDLLAYAKIAPAINQIELHPYNQQVRLIEFCKYKNIQVTAYSPLGTPGTASPGAPNLLQDKIVEQVAKKHSREPAQILIRWALERGTAVIPKSTHLDRIKSNFEVFNFTLDRADLETLASLERRYRFVDPYDWWRVPYFD